MDTSPGPSERRIHMLWACLSDASSGPSLAVCTSMERGGEGRTEHPDAGEACHEDAGLMSHQEGVRQMDLRTAMLIRI